MELIYCILFISPIIFIGVFLAISAHCKKIASVFIEIEFINKLRINYNRSLHRSKHKNENGMNAGALISRETHIMLYEL